MGRTAKRTKATPKRRPPAATKTEIDDLDTSTILLCALDRLENDTLAQGVAAHRVCADLYGCSELPVFCAGKCADRAIEKLARMAIEIANKIRADERKAVRT